MSDGTITTNREGVERPRSPGPRDPDVLLARLADGDETVFPEVFRALWTPTFHLCTRMLSNEADAADAAQAAMEKLFTRSSDFDPARAAVPWALAIAAWECRTIRRRRGRLREVFTGAGEAPPSPLLERERDAEALAIQHELARLAIETLDALSETDREALLATYGSEPGASGAVVRKRRERALERLRVVLRRTYGFP